MSELAERGIGAKIDGEAISWDSAPSGETFRRDFLFVHHSLEGPIRTPKIALLRNPRDSHLNGGSTSITIPPLVCNVLCELVGSTRVASHSMKREAEANGSAYAVDSSTVTRGIDAAVAESAAFQASKPVALLANVQALLGCTTEEVLNLMLMTRRGTSCFIAVAL